MSTQFHTYLLCTYTHINMLAPTCIYIMVPKYVYPETEKLIMSHSTRRIMMSNKDFFFKHIENFEEDSLFYGTFIPIEW